MGAMDVGTIEKNYPLSFRESDAQILGEHVKHRHSVDLIGMKRVGISNFLRYFLYHPEVKKSFISTEDKHMFISVDLNDLVERELQPFWTLTFKRLLDEVERSGLAPEVQQKIGATFLAAIQTNDLFLLLDGLRRSLSLLVQHNFSPTFFFLRFDRIKDAVTPGFLDNLQGLRDATNEKVAYVFTSFRSLDVLSPSAFTKAELSAFSQTMYIKPSSLEDMRVISQHYMERYGLVLDESLTEEVLKLVGGNAQYLQLALIFLTEYKHQLPSSSELFTLLTQDERITLLSEELWESLTDDEKKAVGKVAQGEKLEEEEKKNASYVIDTGIVRETKEGGLFSVLFSEYVLHALKHTSRGEKELVFSKKEHLLFTLLQERQGQICERDEIIEAVWPEYREFGVSDWSIDRLVARVRSKLRKQSSPFEIRTIRTRGYMLTERS